MILAHLKNIGKNMQIKKDLKDYLTSPFIIRMKPDFFYKLGLGIFAVWEVYYTYWWFTIHNKIIKQL